VLLGCTATYTAHSLALNAVAKSPPGRSSPGDPKKWDAILQTAANETRNAEKLKTDNTQANTEFVNVDLSGQHVLSGTTNRTQWLELLKIIDSCLPVAQPDNVSMNDLEKLKAAIPARNELHVTNIDVQQVPDVSAWCDTAKSLDENTSSGAGAAANTVATPAAAGQPVAAGQPGGDLPKGPGWIVRIAGYHYHNRSGGYDPKFGASEAQFVRETLIANLRDMKIKLPTEPAPVAVKDLGVSYPVLILKLCEGVHDVKIPLPSSEAKAGESNTGHVGGPASPMAGGVTRPSGAALEQQFIPLREYPFVVQFCWQPKTPDERADLRKAKEANPNPTDPNAPPAKP
jgi:type IV pilus assembly protein PilM